MKYWDAADRNISEAHRSRRGDPRAGTIWAAPIWTFAELAEMLTFLADWLSGSQKHVHRFGVYMERLLRASSLED